MRRLLITGAAGFLGRTLATYFSRKGWEIYGLDRVAPDNTDTADLKDFAALRLPDPRLEEYLSAWKPDACVHAAGRASVPQSMTDPASDYSDGPALTINVLDALHHCAPDCRFVLLSSAAVYGNPTILPVNEGQTPNPISAYGYHKWQSEILCQEFARLFGLRTISARLFSVYGIGLRRQVMWDLTYKALTQNAVTLQGDGSESRDFLNVLDIGPAVEAILGKAPMHGEAINVSSGEETVIADLARLIVKSIDHPVVLEYSGQLPSGTPLNWRADTGKISSLGFVPGIALREGVAAYVEWCKREVKRI
jgi:UDP-glucose 4-epimerase